MANTHDLGDLVRCTGTFTDSEGAAQDPAEIYFKAKKPSGLILSYQYGVDGELVRSETGVYYVDLDASEAGVWYYKFYSTGSGQAAEETKFRVEESEFD